MAGERDGLARSPTTVLLADNHTLFRRAVMALLENDGEVRIVGDAGRGEEAVRLAEELAPDMVIMQVDENLREARGEIRRILDASVPPPRVIILSLHEDPNFVRAALEVGASAYVHKSGSIDHLLSALRSFARDTSDDNAVVAVPRRVLEQAQEAAGSGLTARELQIVVLAGQGLSNQQIGDRLYITEATVKRHLSNVYLKLGVENRNAAVVRGLSDGWITRADVLRDGDSP